MSNIEAARTPMFSVIIPLYNKQEYIRRCIDSVLSQTFTDFELIVVDDGSTDGSIDIVRSYSDRRIKILAQENTGAGEARNLGINAGLGTWVAFLDADDAWTPEHLGELYSLITGFVNAGIVSTRSTEIQTDKFSSELKKISVSRFRFPKFKHAYVDYFTFTAKNPGFIHSSSVAIRKPVFGEVGFFNSFRQGEDTELFSRICLRYPCAVSNRPTSFYCRGTGGIMETLWNEKIQREHNVVSIRAMGPAVNYLVGEIDSLSPNVRNSAVYFINNSIARAIKISLYNGRIDEINSIGDLFMAPISNRFVFWLYLSKLPIGALMVVFSTRRSMRSIYHSFRAKFDL
ncbi:MAG: glycosyltransferase family A protein [Halioglobus sp.]